MARDNKNTAIFVAYDDDEPFDVARPERGLLRAILATALSDLKRPGEEGRSAYEYLLSPEEDYVFSFRAICDFLNVDPQKVLLVSGVNSTKKRVPSEQRLLSELDKLIAEGLEQSEHKEH